MGFRKHRQKTKAVSAVKRRTWFGFAAEVFTSVLLISAVLCTVVLGGIIWGWSQRNAFLTNVIRQNLQEKYAEWNITFDRAELDQRGRVVLTNVSLNPHRSETPFCQIDGIRVTVDQDLLLHHQKVDIHQVEINHPRVTAVRQTDGSWNWQNLPATSETASALPEIKVRNATLAVVWEQAEFERVLRLAMHEVDIDLQPTSQHGYEFEGVAEQAQLGKSKFTGLIDTKYKTWEISGDLKGLSLDQPFLEMAAQVSSNADQMMTRISQAGGLIQRPEKNTGIEPDANPTQTAALNSENHPQATTASAFNSGGKSPAPFSLKILTNLQFHASQLPGAAPDFSLFAELVNGELTHPDLPMPLDRISGQVAIDRLGIRLDQIRLQSGQTSGELSGQWSWQATAASAADELQIGLQNYRVTPVTRQFLPRSLQNLYDELSPAGLLSLSFGLHRGQNRPIDFDLYQADIREATIRHQMFSYPVTNITGSIKRTDHGIGPEAWEIIGQGEASGQPLKLTGTVVDPGPDCETSFDITVNQIPIDEQFYRALRPTERDVMEYIGLNGMADVHCVVVRQLSKGRKPMIRIDADLYNATMRVKSFPLIVEGITGHIHSDENGWQFTRLDGHHGETPIKGYGTVLPDGEEWKLDLTLAAENGHFDRDLYLAVREASPEVTQVWDLLRPRGDFDINLNVGWMSRGNQVAVEVPLMKLHGCEVTPTVFPWRMSEMTATLAVTKEGVVGFENLKAVHDQCRIETSGAFSPKKDYWQLRFETMVLDDLFPDLEFLAALPTDFRKLFESTKIQQAISMSGKLEFKGDYSGSVVTAAWDAKTILNQVDLYLGMDINNVSGHINYRGQMDRNGTVTIPKGELEFDSCWVMGYHVTNVKGPFRVEKDQIIVGSAKMFDSQSPEEEWATVSREERVTGRVFAGELFLDLLAKRTDAMPYWLRCTLSRADLEQWAIQNNYGQANIKGEVNGYIDLAGDAVSTRNIVGNGRLLISPAALYEVPVMFQMFQSLRFAPIDDTAFRDAYAQFRILDEKFVFDEIGLLGESMSLFGQGTIRFDRTIDLDFVYRPPRRGRFNLASQMLNRIEGVLPVLFTVEVDGTLDLPKVKVQDGVRETLRGFAKLLEGGPAALRPPKIIPPAKIPLQTPSQAAQPAISPF